MLERASRTAPAHYSIARLGVVQYILKTGEVGLQGLGFVNKVVKQQRNLDIPLECPGGKVIDVVIRLRPEFIVAEG